VGFSPPTQAKDEDKKFIFEKKQQTTWLCIQFLCLLIESLLIKMVRAGWLNGPQAVSGVA
jgi:hypothetical protein